MKSIVAFFFALTVALSASANNTFFQAMTQTLEAMDSVKSIEEYQQVANRFERIAQAESSQWLPGYYAAYIYTNMSFMTKEEDDKDPLLDKAQEWMDKILTIAPNESEIYALQALVYQGRIQVSPMMRGMTYSSKVNKVLEKAKALNPENPRSYFLDGQQTYHMPSFIGGGKDNACPLLQTAKAKFDDFTPENDISPNWGRESLIRILKGCEG